MDLARQVRKFSDKHNLFPRGARVVAGVSGGPDSLCLLDLLHTLAPSLNIEVIVAYLDHGLRPEANTEAEMVRGHAQARGLSFVTAQVDTRAHALARRQTLEEAARELRYTFLARTARQAGASLIAVAHTADDQAETVLMHLLRGAGMAGLRGMLPKTGLAISLDQVRLTAEPDSAEGRPLWLVRPLLETWRAEVEAYCADHNLRPVYDLSNQDTTFFRNRLRHSLLPELEKYNPRLRAGLARNAQVLAGEYELVQGLVDSLWRRLVREDAAQVIFDRGEWLNLSVPEQRALLREAVARLLKHPRDIDFAPIESAVRFSRRAATGRSCDVQGGLRLSMGYTNLRLSLPGVEPWLPEDMPLLDDKQQLPAGWQFRVTPLGPGEWPPEQMAAPRNEWRIFVDGARVAGTLRLRRRLPGDSFHPLGLNGHRQKISDCMINAKVEGGLRDRWPLVVCDRAAGEAGIVWVAGLKADEGYKITAQTQTVWQVEFKRAAG